MLAYVFWHWSKRGEGGGDYRARLVEFHRALAASAPQGYRGSRVFAVTAAPWAPAARDVLEDWYFVDDFTALGVLNDAAVSARNRGTHDAIAARADGGAAGLYKLCTARVDAPAGAAWFAKPAASSYATFFAGVAPEIELWQRQMVLGPAPEFCALASTLAGLGSLGGGAQPIEPIERIEAIEQGL